ncbi:MAG: MFS transporter [Rhodospirillales bacterium]|nr:MFS transporter [Rhodospirillales bacterium]
MTRLFYGWRVVAACFVIAAVAWSLGLFGSSVYLQAVTSAHGWPIAEVASAITLFFLVSAAIQRIVGRSIDRWGPRPVLLLGLASMATGVALIGQVAASWQLYPCFALLGFGWSTLSMTGITTTVAPWFERHQGRSMTLAIMGASVGAIVGVPLLLLAIGELGLGRGLIAASVVAVLLIGPLVAIVLRYRGPADLGLRRDGEVVHADAPPKIGMLPIATPANRGWLLWSATIGFALGLTIQIGFITHHVALAEPLFGRAGAGMLVSAAGITAFVGRLILARIVDSVDARRLACFVMMAQAAALLAIALWPTVPVLIVGSLVYGYGIGHVTTLGPVVIRREFGAAAFGVTYGTAATVIQLTSAFGPAMFGFLRDGFGGYGPGFVIAAVVTLIGCASLFAGSYLGRIVSVGSSGRST